MNIHLEYSLTEADLSENIKAVLQTKSGRRGISVVFFPIIVFVAAAIYVIFLLRSPGSPPTTARSDGTTALSAWFCFGPILAIIVLYCVWAFWAKSIARRSMKADPTFADLKQVDLTERQITQRMPSSATSWEWSHFTRFQETATLFLLFTGPQSTLILPKRAFPTPTAIDEFRAFAQAHVGNTPIGFPVLPAKVGETGGGAGDVLTGKEPS